MSCEVNCDMEEIHLLVKDESLSRNAIAFNVPVENLLSPQHETDTGKCWGLWIQTIILILCLLEMFLLILLSLKL